MTKKVSWGGKGLLELYFYIVVHHLRKPEQEFRQGRNPEAEANREAMEECCFLACSPGLKQPAFLEIIGHQSRDGTAHNGLDPLLSITDYENAYSSACILQSYYLN